MSLNPIAPPTVELRPLSVGQIFDRAIRLYRNNFLTFVGIIALSRILITVATILLSVLAPASEIPIASPELANNPFFAFTQSFTQATGTSFIAGTYMIAILSWILTMAGAAAMTRAAFDAYFGQAGTIMDGFRRMGRAWWTLLGATFIAGLVGFLLALWTWVPLIGWFTGPGMIFFYTLVVVPLMTPVVVVEKRKATRALPRALDLGQRRFWWFIGFLLLLAIFAQVIVTGPTLLLFGAIEAISGSGVSPIVSVVLSQAITLLFNVLYVPIQLSCLLLMYLDVRVRTEGLDLALKTGADSEEEEGQDALFIASQAPRTETGYFPNRSYFVKYLFVTLAFIGLYAAIVFLFVGLITLLGPSF